MTTTTTTLTLNSHGWTGELTAHATSATHAYVNTDGAHVNDDTPAATYRGKRYLVSVDVRRHATTMEVSRRAYGCKKSDGTMRNDRDLTPTEGRTLHNAIHDAIVANADALREAMNAAEGVRLSNALAAADLNRAHARDVLTAAEIAADDAAKALREWEKAQA